jgi:hypothetical protein
MSVRVGMELNDSWRCSGPCGQLMYNVERINGTNYPSETAPAGMFISTDYPRVCHVCWELFLIISDKKYWQELSEKDKDKKKRLGPNGKFLS